MKRFVPVMLVSALLLVMALPARAATGAQDLRIGDYVLVSKTRIGPLHWQLAYRATLANRGATDLGGARAELARILDFLIVDGQLSFGPVAAGKSVASSDTFTLRSATGYSIDPRLLELLLRWKITPANAAPAADAGDDQAVVLGDTVTLDGSGSSDADGDPLMYRWEFAVKPAGSGATLTGATTAAPSFTPDMTGAYDVALIVNDGATDSAPDSVTVSVGLPPPPPNRDPQITSSPVTTGQSGQAYGYQVVASDPDADPLVFSLTASPAGMTIGAAGLIAWTPAGVGHFAVTVEVTDGRGGHATQSFSIEVTGEPGVVPPPTVTVTADVPVAIASVPGIAGAPARAVAALTDASNIPMHFVANELIVVSDDLAAVNALAARHGGTVVRTFTPGDFGLPGAAQHLVRIDPSTFDPSNLADDLHAIEPETTNTLRVSSDAALRLLAAAASERVDGLEVTLNTVAGPATFDLSTTTENPDLAPCPAAPSVPPGNDNCVRPLIGGTEQFWSDAYRWSYIQNGGNQDIGVGEAWRSLSLAAMLTNKVKIAVIDGGFSMANVDNPLDFEYDDNDILDDNPFPPNENNCTNNQPCPWHGSNVVSTAMGPADDSKGAAGTGGPVARGLAIRYGGDTFSLTGALAVAVTKEARIINMSFNGRFPATMAWNAGPLNLVTSAMHGLGFLLVGSAGNDGQDIDSEDCLPPLDTPCWEDAWYWPCENDGVFCIGALNDNATTRWPSSNIGAEDVDLFAPGGVWVGGDPGDPEPHRFGATSAAAPFVSGVAALVIAANPSLRSDAIESILIQTATTSTDGNVRRFINARGAVNQALGGSPVCVPPTIFSWPIGSPTVPCVERTFEVTHSQSFGPFRYEWRRYVPGNNTPIVLTDGDNVSGATTARLTINPFRPGDEGTYEAVVGNLCGSTASPAATMTVTDGAAAIAPSLPESLDNHAMAYDSDRNRLVVYGGITTVQYQGRTHFMPRNETWERTADGAWQTVTDVGPGRRHGAAMAYDEARGVTVMFGGFICALNEFCPWGNPGGLIWYTDTWEWNGSTWTQIQAHGSGPPYGRFHSLTYDSVRRRVVMYGGQEPGGTIGTTPFEWDGATWTPRPTLPDAAFGYPPPVLPSPIAFDRARNVLVLYRVFDTWELDGATSRWARRSGRIEAMGTTSMPGGIAYDTDRQRTLLFNDVNDTPTTMTSALWEWTGSTWIRKHAPLMPPGNNMQMAYDRARRRTAMVGLLGPGFSYSQVWEWRYFTPDPTCALGPQ